MESFFGTMQLELLDRKTWDTRAELASAIFEWIEGWYNPQRRHTPRSTTSARSTTNGGSPLTLMPRNLYT